MSHAAHDSHQGGHDHDDHKPHGFLNTVFDSTMGGFGILWVSLLIIAIFCILLLG